MKKLVVSIVIVFLFTYAGRSQEEKTFPNLNANGYLSAMPSIMWNSDSSQWQTLLHNRLNLNWYWGSHFSASLQFRNQLIGGDVIETMPVEEGFVKQNYAAPLTLQEKLGNTYMLSLAIDRAWMQYTYKKFELKLGRQRINWGQTFVWNPNDIFNTYNFFDFDYPERPGADAIRMVYYPNYNSSAELAAKVDSAGKVTAGGMYRFTLWNTEFQMLGGYFSQENKFVVSDTLPALQWDDKDILGGFGFSAGIQSVSLRGEFTYLYATSDSPYSKSRYMGSLTLDYTAPNELGVMFESFYVSEVFPPTGLFGGIGGSQNIRSMAFTKYNFFAQLSYPIIPILNASAAGMYFTDDTMAGYYAGPSLDLSLGDNLALGVYFQFLGVDFKTKILGIPDHVNYNYGYLRAKWNF